MFRINFHFDFSDYDSLSPENAFQLIFFLVDHEAVS